MRHILVVDDMPAICDVVRLALEFGGSTRVTAASTIPDAVAVMMQDPPDAAVIDAVLPGVSGLQLARWTLTRGVPVLIISGEPTAQQELDEIGCHYLRKPFSIAALQAETRALWDEARERRAITAVSLRRMKLDMAELAAVVARASRTVSRSKAGRTARLLPRGFDGA